MKEESDPTLLLQLLFNLFVPVPVQSPLLVPIERVLLLRKLLSTEPFDDCTSKGISGPEVPLILTSVINDEL